MIITMDTVSIWQSLTLIDTITFENIRMNSVP